MWSFIRCLLDHFQFLGLSLHSHGPDPWLERGNAKRNLRRVGGEVLLHSSKDFLPPVRPLPPLPPNFPRAYKLHAARRIQIAAFNNANNAMNHGTTERFRRQPVLRVYRQVTEPAPRNIYNPSMEIQWSKIPNYSRGHVKCCRSRAINCHGAGNNNSMMESEFPWICRGCCLTLGLDDD